MRRGGWMLAAALSLMVSHTAGAASLGLQATVPDRRVAVVQAGHIASITSNTAHDVAPEFRIDSEQGQVIAADSILASEYRQALHHANNSRLGIIYQVTAQQAVYQALRPPHFMRQPCTLL